MSVSVVIPVHNSEKYLDACMQSVLTQGVSDMEVILVENGSGDSTVAMCQNYVEKYSFVKFLDIGPAGVSAARNAGLKSSTKEWVVFVDSDDLLQPNALSVPVRNGASAFDVILSGYSRQYPEESVPGDVREIDPDLLQKGVLQFARYGKRIMELAPIDDFSIWACWGKFYKRKFLIDNKISFPYGIKTGEDSGFCFQVYGLAKAVGTANDITYYYRENEQSVIHVKNYDIRDNNLKLIRYFESYRKAGMTDEFPEREYNSFIAARVIEIAYGIDKREWGCFLGSKRIRDILEKADLCYLIPGKRNSVHYGKMLLKLKVQCKRYILRGR